MMNLLKKMAVALIVVLTINSCGSDDNGSSNPPATDYALKTAGEFEDTFLNYTIASASGNKAVILANKKANYFIANQFLSGSYVYSYISMNNATIKHTIGGIICNQTLTFISRTSGNISENCQGSNGTIDSINQTAGGSFELYKTPK